MDIISLNEASTANGRIEKFIENPDSTSGIVTIPKTIASGETVTIPAGRVAVLPNVQVDGTLNVEGEVFIPSGATFGDLESQIALKADTSYVNNKYSGFKNYIINGGFDVWQRGTSFVVNSTDFLLFTADRWKTIQQYAVGALTVLKSTLSYGGVTCNSEKIVASTAVVVSGGSQCIPFYYKIEGSDAYSLNGKPFTVSFLFNTNVAGTYPITFNTSADGNIGNNTYCTTFNAVSGVQKITITIPAVNTISYTNGYGLRIIIGSVSSIYTTDITDTWLANSNSIAHLANSFNWAGVVGNYIEIAQVQLEEGSVATPFEQRPIGLELSLCQRYYEIIAVERILCSNDNVNSWFGATVTSYWKSTKRVTPTVTLINWSGTMTAVPTPSAFGLDAVVTTPSVQAATNQYGQFGLIGSAEL